MLSKLLYITEDKIMSKLDRIIVGNTVIYPALAEFLKRSHYFMSYDPKKEVITLSANHGGGGQDLFEIRNASHENAVKLAKELGLTTRNEDREHACAWGKYYEVLRLLHDGSTEAEWLRIEIFKLGIPCRVREIQPSLDIATNCWALHMCGAAYTPPMWKVVKVLDEIKSRNFNQSHKPTLDIS